MIASSDSIKSYLALEPFEAVGHEAVRHEAVDHEAVDHEGGETECDGYYAAEEDAQIRAPIGPKFTQLLANPV